MSRVATLRSKCSGRGGGGDSAVCGVRSAGFSLARARAACRETDSLAMRAAATSSGPGQLGARRQKTDLHVAEPAAAARSASPAPSLRSQRARQYRCHTYPTQTIIARIVFNYCAKSHFAGGNLTVNLIN